MPNYYLKKKVFSPPLLLFSYRPLSPALLNSHLPHTPLRFISSFPPCPRPFFHLLFSFQMAVMISSGFLIAWTPYVAVSFWSMFHSQEQGHMTPFVTLLPCLFAKSSTVYNPFIYFIFQRASRHKLTRLQRLMFCCSHKANSPAEGGKLESKMVEGSECTIFGNGTDDTCVGLMGVPGSQSESEMMTLG